MNLKDQVLSIDQVQELQELGFDVHKHSSMYYHPDYGLEDGTIKLLVQDLLYIPTLTIGDIINILPTEIDEFILNINRKYVAYDSKTTNLFYAYRYRFIDSLFDCLVWCIKQKHIEL